MPSSESLCCTCPGVRARVLYEKLVNGVPVMQFSKNSLGDARDRFPHQGWKSPHHLTSRDQKCKVKYPAPLQGCQPWFHAHCSLLKESTSGANKLKSLWFLEKEVCCQNVYTWVMIKFGGPTCGLCLWFSICLGVLTVGVKSVNGNPSHPPGLWHPAPNLIWLQQYLVQAVTAGGKDTTIYFGKIQKLMFCRVS